MPTYDGISVVIPHYGDPAHARSLATALLADPPPVPLQVVVVDDASPTPYPDQAGVEVVRRERNGGFGSAVDSGVAVARHPLLLVLNSDLEPPPGALATLLVTAGPLLPAVVAPTVVDPAGRPTGGYALPRTRTQVVEWLTVLARWHHAPRMRRLLGRIAPPDAGGVREVGWVSGEAVLVDAASFRAVGGFDESFYMYAEEVDLQRRLHAAGVPSYVVDTAPWRHAGGGSSDPARVREWLVAARFHYARTWDGEGRLRAALTVASLVNLLTNTARRAGGRDVAPLATLREELRLLWRIGRTPPQTQAQARAR